MTATVSASIRIVLSASPILVLLIAELGDEPVVGVGARESGERQHRVSIDHQNLAESAAGGSDEHQDPHRLLVSEAALLGRVAEQLDPSHDPAHRRVVDDFCLVDACGGAGLLGKPVEARVRGAEPLPALITERHSSVVSVVEYEHVELLDVGHQPVDPMRAELSPVAGPASVRAHRVDEAHVVEHQRTDPKRVLAQVGRVHATLGEKAAEGHDRAEPVLAGRPAEQAGLHPDTQMPLQTRSQPRLRYPVEVQGARPVGLVLAARDPRVELQVPDLALPPVARVVGEAQDLVTAAQDRGQVALSRSAGDPASFVCPHRQQLPHPNCRGRGHQRGPASALARRQRIQHCRQMPSESVKRLMGH